MIRRAAPFHVSDPGSPGFGTVQKRHTSLPVSWSCAATKPLAPCSPPVTPEMTRLPAVSGGRRIVLAPVRERRVPQQRAGPAVQRDHVRVVGFHEHPIAGDRDAAVRVACDDAGRPRPLEVPDLPPLPASSAMHSFGAVTYMMPPATCGVPCSPPAPWIVAIAARARHRRLVDLRQRRVAVAAGVAVVGRPVGVGRDLANALAVAAQEPDRPSAVTCRSSSPSPTTVPSRAAASRHECPRRGGRRRIALDRPEVADQRGQFGGVECGRRHAAQRDPSRISAASCPSSRARRR